MKIINIREKYESSSDYWKPRVIAELNDQQVIIAKVKGELSSLCSTENSDW